MNIVDNVKKVVSGISRMIPGRRNVVVIVQCRLSSTRLPGKALLDLDGRAVLEWTLSAMKMVRASKYYLAVDVESEKELRSVAEKCGWDFYAGSQKDVLKRFCDVIEISKADVVVRATADNPFLFYEAANELLGIFLDSDNDRRLDYATFSGLPHGSGIEIFRGDSLVSAAAQTDLEYDHEHVGPSLYNHRDKFSCEFIPAPEKYNHPQLRTTIDTAEDYRRACRIVRAVSEKRISSGKNDGSPYTADEVLSALEESFVKYPAVLVPSVKKGCGTGHLQRCLGIALENGWDVLVDEKADLAECDALVKNALDSGLKSTQIIRKVSDVAGYSLAVLDLFRSDYELASKIAENTVVCTIDDGAKSTDFAEYVLDVIPSIDMKKKVNLAEPGFIPLPKNLKSDTEKNAAIHNALVVFGGEDPSNLSLPCALSLAECGLYTTVIVGDGKKQESLSDQIPEDLRKLVKVQTREENLKEKLHGYDLVMTHYGFTAFEAASVGCAVITAGTTDLHVRLSEKFGFACLRPSEIRKSNIEKLLGNQDSLRIEIDFRNADLPSYLKKIASGNHFGCPVCGKNSPYLRNSIVERTKDRTFRKCSCCGMTYISWTVKEKQTEYNHAYFFDDYETQYGKTYLEDFPAIKRQCMKRLSNIDFLFHRFHKSASPSVLDIGCAMGPFLDAANDSGWKVYGTDICQEAVDYVKGTLHYPATVSAFPDSDFVKEFGVEKFDAVTMWYVIEHFQDLDKVLSKVSSIVKEKGIFAFSTPSASGISGRFSKKGFFEQSPSDHFSVWDTKNARNILKRYGFRIERIVSTGIHPERFPAAKKNNWDRNSFRMKALALICRVFKLGDTMEIYCRKEKQV